MAQPTGAAASRCATRHARCDRGRSRCHTQHTNTTHPTHTRTDTHVW
jgi:hypothetical protein